jgi:hydroxyacyl-ACP dehydratase HTD2-like protein with hotdog domain
LTCSSWRTREATIASSIDESSSNRISSFFQALLEKQVAPLYASLSIQKEPQKTDDKREDKRSESSLMPPHQVVSPHHLIPVRVMT